MNGPEHYREAERLLENARRTVVEATPNTVTEALDMQDRAARVAQVHATLALAAATAAAQATAYDGDELGQRSREWAGVS